MAISTRRLALLALLACGCNETAQAHPETAPSPVPVKEHAAEQEEPSNVVVDTSDYPWHRNPSIKALIPVDTLEQRFAPPDGFTRVSIDAGTFGAWLRQLPLTSADAPVLAYDGRVLLESGHPHLAAVSTLDVGNRDLQQCADAIMRLHAEWLWSVDRQSEASYPTGAGNIPWPRFVNGGIPKPKGRSFTWSNRGKQPATHASYRKYLDIVFSWANTGSLALRAAHVNRDHVRPGDFFVLAGSPGHAVLLLDIAENADGKRVALLGQSFMPAQRFQVLRPSRDQLWFELDGDTVATPFWVPFPWKALRRLD